MMPHRFSSFGFAGLALGTALLLVPIAAGRVTPEMRSIITLTDRLKAEMPKMLSEHKAIVAPRPPDCCGCLVKHIPFRPRATRASCFEIIMSQKVLVTGAASGIGLEMARVLNSRRNRVYC